MFVTTGCPVVLIVVDISGAIVVVAWIGALVGTFVVTSVGTVVGVAVGIAVGIAVGNVIGGVVGNMVGCFVVTSSKITPKHNSPSHSLTATNH